MDNLEKKEQELKAKNHLMAYDLLKTFARQLDNPESDVFELLEFDDSSLNVAAKATVLASAILRKAALDIQIVSGIEDTNKYETDFGDDLQRLVSIADELDASDDPELVKKAGVIDEIILSMSSAIEKDEEFKLAMDKKIEDIKKRSKDKDTLKKSEGAVESIDDTDGGSYRPLQAPLSSRSFPGSPGTPMVRTEQGWYNIDTGEQINFEEGYNLNGKKVPGTSVENQTDNLEGVKIPNQLK